MYIHRYFDNLDNYLKPQKALIILGPRQIGKTTLTRKYLERQDKKCLYVSGDDIRMREVWSSMRLDMLKEFTAGYEKIIIDEAQRIPNIGISVKLLIDARVPTNIILTGSSSFELTGQIGEPLTGRKRTLHMFPLSLTELKEEWNTYKLRENLEDFLIYGMYPEVLLSDNKSERTDVLNEITGSYLLKDILELNGVKGSKILLDLLRLLAFQVGSLVSLRELGTRLGLDYKTVARYLDLLEKGFVLYNLRGYSRNLRKEITKKSKYYFYDTGIRNALIANFNPIHMRNDIGPLWENFCFMERLKKLNYTNTIANLYFWRTWDGQEIDFVEEREGNVFGFEIKWSKSNPKPPKDWRSTYPEAGYQVISRDNFPDLLL